MIASQLLVERRTTLTGTADAGAVIEIFKTDAYPDAAGGEGKTFLGSVEADGSGNWIATVEGLVPGDKATATAGKISS